MKHTYTEYICDYCGGAEHFLVHVKNANKVSPDKYARTYGWIITADGKHFCTKECYKNFKKNLTR